MSAPAEYVCGACGARGVKLWREANTFLVHQTLRCAACAAPSGDVGEDGKIKSKYGRTDQIGGRLPAVPDPLPGPDLGLQGTFWGYTSVPEDGVAWWRSLPTKAVAP